MATLILLRHGQSTWNLENLFTGWVDVDLSARGTEEAARAGALLVESGLLPDVVHTSLQRRAIRTAELALHEADRQWIPVRRSWRLNERHYGALQGKDKKQTADEFGIEQVKVWRRAYAVPPPPLALDDPGHPRFDPRYAALPAGVRSATRALPARWVRRRWPMRRSLRLCGTAAASVRTPASRATTLRDRRARSALPACAWRKTRRRSSSTRSRGSLRTSCTSRNRA